MTVSYTHLCLRFTEGFSTEQHLVKIYSAIVEISSDLVEISSAIVEISSELVEISSELVCTKLELLIISAFRNVTRFDSAMPVPLPIQRLSQLLRFSFVRKYVKGFASSITNGVFQLLQGAGFITRSLRVHTLYLSSELLHVF